MRESCPACGMLMIVTGGFDKERTQQTQECLRCGFMTSPVGQVLPSDSAMLDSQKAKRFRDKAAEAEQMIATAQTAARRESLESVADSYNRMAEHLEKLSTETAVSAPKTDCPTIKS